MNDDEDESPTPPVATLSARLLDNDFREGYHTGYELALGDLMARCEFLLARTAAIADLRHYVQGLREQLAQETGNQRIDSEK